MTLSKLSGSGGGGNGETQDSLLLSLVISAVTGTQADAGTSLAAGERGGYGPSTGLWPEP